MRLLVIPLLVPGLALLALIQVPGQVAAQPQAPATYFGTATVDGQNVPDGTEVHAFIDGVECTQPGSAERGTIVEGGVSSYAILVMHESQKPGCGRDDAVVTFTIGGRAAVQTVEWQSGLHELNLSAGEGSPVPLPTATPTPPPDATALAATATGQARFTPLTSATALPTDDPGVLDGVGNGVGAGPGESAEGTSAPIIAWVAIVAGALALGGAAVGFAISRRR